MDIVTLQLAKKYADKMVGAGSGGTVSTVTITSIQESEEDGGLNIVTFSDGRTLNIKNGRKGQDAASFLFVDDGDGNITISYKE